MFIPRNPKAKKRSHLQKIVMKVGKNQNEPDHDEEGDQLEQKQEGETGE